ncbi:MAG: hypothetical protein HOJ35_09795 [Bdellovibrionales bacterium]|jgi:hypothetical protein|nr:hypothetical protein [Bdellovibrionales bacterium]
MNKLNNLLVFCLFLGLTIPSSFAFIELGSVLFDDEPILEKKEIKKTLTKKTISQPKTANLTKKKKRPIKKKKISKRIRERINKKFARNERKNHKHKKNKKRIKKQFKIASFKPNKNKHKRLIKKFPKFKQGRKRKVQ